jgi:hypothetical protein
MGTAEAKISVNWNDPDADMKNKIITIATTGHFGDDTQTVTTKLFLSTDASHSDQFADFIVSSSSFSLAKAEQKALEYNALAPDPSPVLEGLFWTVGESYIKNNSWNQFGADMISAGQTNREIKLEDFFSWASNATIKSGSGGNTWPSAAAYAGFPWLTHTNTNWPTANIFETFNYQASNSSTVNVGSAINYVENDRTFISPANGRMTFNPLKNDGRSGANIDSDYNTKLSCFSVNGTAGKNDRLRLAGDSKNTAKYNAYMGIDFVDQNTGANVLANPHVEYVPNNAGMNVTLGKSGNSYNSATPDFNSDTRRASWYPQKWNSCAIFTQAGSDSTINAGINARLVFGPFQHGYRSGDDSGYYDYWGWGSYVSNPNYGQAQGDAFKAYPEFSNGSGKNKRGMPSVPVYYGNNFDLYLLDNVGTTTAEKANPSYKGNLAWIQQGMSVLNELDSAGEPKGSIYSLRGLAIGGMHRRTANWVCASDGVRIGSSIDGWVDDDDPTEYALAQFTQTRYSTLIYNTDIILRTPNGKSTPRTSAFNSAKTYLDQYLTEGTSNSDRNKFWRRDYAKYYPKTKIYGGRVYVGEGQTLNVQGGVQLYNRSSGSNNTSGANSGKPVSGDLIPTGEYTMYVAPESITIAADAAVIIEASENENVDTKFYVSGSLNLKSGSRVKGDILVENGAVLTLEGSCNLTGNIYVKNGGKINIASGAVITGDVYCAGAMSLSGSVTVNHPAVMTDDPNTAADESQAALHGIYIYNSPSIGVGSISVAAGSIVAGNSGKIHSFAGYPALTGTGANSVFCNINYPVVGVGRDPGNNTCKHWTSEIGTWRKQVSEIE